MSGTAESVLIAKATTALRLLWVVVVAAFALGGWMATEHYTTQNSLAELRAEDRAIKKDHDALHKVVTDHNVWAAAREKALSEGKTRSEKMLQRVGDKLGVSFEGIE